MSHRRNYTTAGDTRPARPSSAIVLLVSSPKNGARIRDGLAGEPAQILTVFSVAQLRDVCNQLGTRLRAVVLEAIDEHGRPTAPFVTELRARAPDLAILACWPPVDDDAMEILALADAGVHHVVFPGRQETPGALRRDLHLTQLACIAARGVKRLPSTLPPRLKEFIKFCLRFPSFATSVSAVAVGLGVNRRTLGNACASAGAVVPEAIVSRCRVLVAADLIRVSGASVERVALELGFSSGTALRNLMRRHVGMLTSELRAPGAMDKLFARFLHSLRERALLELEPVTAPVAPVAQERNTTDAA